MWKTISLKFVFVLFICAASVSCSNDSGAKKSVNANQTTIVEAVPVKTQMWREQINAVGTLAANQGVVVKSEVPGRITKILFQSGAYVKKGTPLIQLNQALLKAQLASAKAQHLLSKSNYRRMANLVNRKAAAKSEVDKARASLSSDAANVALVEAKLAQTVIKSPFDGHLGLRLVDVGDYITAGQPIVNLQDDTLMRVDFSVPEIYLSVLHKGDKVILHSTAFPDQEFSGSLYAIDSVVEKETRSINVRATIPNRQHQLVPGAFTEVTTLAGKNKKVLTIPQIAVIYSADDNYVYRIVDGHAIKTNIELGQRRGNEVVIVKGLKSSDEVVTSGQLKIGNGSLVKAKRSGDVASKIG